jgi:hypothetical protein
MRASLWAAMIVGVVLAGATLTSASSDPPTQIELAGKKGTIALSCAEKGDRLRCRAKRKGLRGPAGPAGARGLDGTAGPPGPTAFGSASKDQEDNLPEAPVALNAVEASLTTTFPSRFAVQASIGLNSPGVVVPALVGCRAQVTAGPDGVGDGLGPDFATEVSPFAPPTDATLSITGSNPAANPVYEPGTYSIAVFCSNRSSGQVTATARALNVTAVAAP